MSYTSLFIFGGVLGGICRYVTLQKRHRKALNRKKEAGLDTDYLEQMEFNRESFLMDTDATIAALEQKSGDPNKIQRLKNNRANKAKWFDKKIKEAKEVLEEGRVDGRKAPSLMIIVWGALIGFIVAIIAAHAL